MVEDEVVVAPDSVVAMEVRRGSWHLVRVAGGGLGGFSKFLVC